MRYVEQHAEKMTNKIPSVLTSAVSGEVAPATVITVDSISAVDFSDEDGFIPTAVPTCNFPT
jgi:hypothetical protein